MKYFVARNKLYELDHEFVDYQGKNVYVAVGNICFDETEIQKKPTENVKELFDTYVICQYWTNSWFTSDNFDCQNNIDSGYYKSIGLDNPRVFGGVFTWQGIMFVAEYKDGKWVAQ